MGGSDKSQSARELAAGDWTNPIPRADLGPTRQFKRSDTWDHPEVASRRIETEIKTRKQEHIEAVMALNKIKIN